MKILMKKDFEKTIDWFRQNYSQEIAGWIVGKISPEGIICEELLIPKQEVNSGSVDMSKEQIINLMKEYGKKCDKIIGEWHSHNTMSAFWSSTDEEFMEQYMKPRDIGIFIVSGKEGHLCRIELRKPIGISVDKVDYEVEPDKKDEKFGLEMQQIVKDKLIEKTYTAYSYERDWKWNTGIGYESYAKKKEQERSINSLLNGVVSFHNDNKVVLKGIDIEIADMLVEEHYDKKPRLELKGKDANITFQFDNKKTALDFMQRELKPEIARLLEEEKEAEERADKIIGKQLNSDDERYWVNY